MNEAFHTENTSLKYDVEMTDSKSIWCFMLIHNGKGCTMQFLCGKSVFGLHLVVSHYTEFTQHYIEKLFHTFFLLYWSCQRNKKETYVLMNSGCHTVGQWLFPNLSIARIWNKVWYVRIKAMYLYIFVQILKNKSVCLFCTGFTTYTKFLYIFIHYCVVRLLVNDYSQSNWVYRWKWKLFNYLLVQFFIFFQLSMYIRDVKNTCTYDISDICVNVIKTREYDSSGCWYKSYRYYVCVKDLETGNCKEHP